MTIPEEVSQWISSNFDVDLNRLPLSVLRLPQLKTIYNGLRCVEYLVRKRNLPRKRNKADLIYEIQRLFYLDDAMTQVDQDAVIATLATSIIKHRLSLSNRTVSTLPSQSFVSSSIHGRDIPLVVPSPKRMLIPQNYASPIPRVIPSPSSSSTNVSTAASTTTFISTGTATSCAPTPTGNRPSQGNRPIQSQVHLNHCPNVTVSQTEFRLLGEVIRRGYTPMNNREILSSIRRLTSASGNSTEGSGSNGVTSTSIITADHVIRDMLQNWLLPKSSNTNAGRPQTHNTNAGVATASAASSIATASAASSIATESTRFCEPNGNRSTQDQGRKPQNPEETEKRLLLEVVRRGYLNNREILTSIRKLTSASSVNSAEGNGGNAVIGTSSKVTADLVIHDILLNREEERFTRDMDTARLNSEMDQQMHRETRRKRLAQEQLEILQTATLAEWMDKKDMFKNSWLLKCPSCHLCISTHVHANSTSLKTCLIELLKLEKKCRHWYGHLLPSFYFEDMVAERLSSCVDASALEETIKIETVKLREGVMLLSNQNGNVPHIFLDAQILGRKHRGYQSDDGDGEVILVETRRPTFLAGTTSK